MSILQQDGILWTFIMVSGGPGISLLRSTTEVSPLLFYSSLFQSRVHRDNADKGRKSEVRRDIDIRYTIERERYFQNSVCFYSLMFDTIKQ